MTRLAGRVYSHTTIRVPGTGHADRGPFTLVLVDLNGGGRVLGRLATAPLPESAPDIGTPVTGSTGDDNVPIFRVSEEQ